jgi:hypothetical protein
MIILSLLHDLSRLNHELYALKLGDVCEWIAVDRDDVGELAGRRGSTGRAVGRRPWSPTRWLAWVLVQREVEITYSPLANTTPFSASKFGTHRPTYWRVVERTAAELQMVSKRKTRWVVRAHRARVGGRNNLAPEK